MRGVTHQVLHPKYTGIGGPHHFLRRNSQPLCLEDRYTHKLPRGDTSFFVQLQGRGGGGGGGHLVSLIACNEWQHPLMSACIAEALTHLQGM